MAKRIDHLGKVLVLSGALEKGGFQPILVGGMALVILGSPRVTRDFDFLISLRNRTIPDLMVILYGHDLELVTKFTPQGEVLRTVDNPNVASLKVRSEAPRSLFFFDWSTRLKVDLLLDFPLPAGEVAGRSIKVKIRTRSFRIASKEDLLRLKEIAYGTRRSAVDAQDLAFLRGLGSPP